MKVDTSWADVDYLHSSLTAWLVQFSASALQRGIGVPCLTQGLSILELWQYYLGVVSSEEEDKAVAAGSKKVGKRRIFYDKITFHTLFMIVDRAFTFLQLVAQYPPSKSQP